MCEIKTQLELGWPPYEAHEALRDPVFIGNFLPPGTLDFDGLDSRDMLQKGSEIHVAFDVEHSFMVPALGKRADLLFSVTECQPDPDIIYTNLALVRGLRIPLARAGLSYNLYVNPDQPEASILSLGANFSRTLDPIARLARPLLEARLTRIPEKVFPGVGRAA